MTDWCTILYTTVSFSLSLSVLIPFFFFLSGEEDVVDDGTWRRPQNPASIFLDIQRQKVGGFSSPYILFVSASASVYIRTHLPPPYTYVYIIYYRCVHKYLSKYYIYIRSGQASLGGIYERSRSPAVSQDFWILESRKWSQQQTDAKSYNLI